jgi:hypothetical protein
MSEIDLEGPGPSAEPPAPEPEAAPAPVVDVAAEPEPEPATEPDPAPEAKPEPKKGGMLAELIEERQRARAYERELNEYKQAMIEGRLVQKPIAPQPTVDEQQRAELQQTADQLRLYTVNDKGEKVYDWDAARNALNVIDQRARKAVAPLQQMTLEQRADKNIADVWAKAQADGIPSDVLNTIVNAEFKAVMAQPNAAQMLSQPEIVETVFERALGKAFRAGKLTGTAKPKAPAPAPVMAEPSGRRGPAAAAIQLSPAVAGVYQSHGIDPNKSKPPVVDSRGHIELE